MYGDNTEFRNPFREGETIFGAAVWMLADVDVNDRVTIALGGFGNLRFGSDDAFELVRPIVSLDVHGRRSSFVFGTLRAPRTDRPMGPDRMGAHGLLPPLQRETLAFDRPYEAGLQWRFAASRLRHDVWLTWQRVNTAAHRERFNGGLDADLRATGVLSIPFQIHVVHEGGQLFASGPVADSAAAAAGVQVRIPTGRPAHVSLEAFGLISRFVPDRSVRALTRDGTGFFGRATVEQGGWRGHVIFWRGRNFIKEEGDPNYMSVTRGGVRYRGTRDYAEAGLARRFSLAPGAAVEVSGRLHRVEKYYEYSYRVSSIIDLGWKLR